MMPLAEISPQSYTILLIGLGAVALYISSRMGADALARHTDGSPAGRMALGHWAPIAAVVVLAAAQGQAAIALGVLFGSAVAAMSLAAGLIIYVKPPDELPPSRRAWPFLLPAAMLPMIAGFSGHFSALDALIIALLGTVIFWVWWGTSRRESTVAVGIAAPTSQRAGKPAIGLLAAQWILAIALAVLGAKIMVWGAVMATHIALPHGATVLRGNIVPAAMLAPLLVLPIIATGSDMAQRGGSADAISAIVFVALLNLCLLLPIVVVIWYIRSAAPWTPLPSAIWRLWHEASPIPLPVSIWRIDTIVLVILGLALVPVAMARWVVDRFEAIVLVLGYAAYLIASAKVAQRM